ncbi:MAG: nucleotide-binding protein, partial [Nanoarchaeota archaeon]|nr:nucleotide-binding protein [Nanoarchaeota archaeon]
SPVHMTAKIIIDTNFLLIPAQFKVDIFGEIERIMHEPYELYIIDRTTDELRSIIERQRGKDKEAAKLALSLLERYPVKALKTPETERLLNVDRLILKQVRTHKYVVATQDAALKQKLRQNNVRLIVLRQKKFLMLI